jgi:hypothetical protein
MVKDVAILQNKEPLLAQNGDKVPQCLIIRFCVYKNMMK